MLNIIELCASVLEEQSNGLTKLEWYGVRVEWIMT